MFSAQEKPNSMPLLQRMLNRNLQEEAAATPSLQHMAGARQPRRSVVLPLKPDYAVEAGDVDQFRSDLRRASCPQPEILNEATQAILGAVEAESHTSRAAPVDTSGRSLQTAEVELAKVKAELVQAKAEAENNRLLSLKLKDENDNLRSELQSCNDEMTKLATNIKERDDELAELKAEADNNNTERDLLRANNLRLAHERDEVQKTLLSMSNNSASVEASPRGGPLSRKGTQQQLHSNLYPPKKSLRHFLEKRTSSKYMERINSSRSVASQPITTPESCLWNQEDDVQDNFGHEMEGGRVRRRGSTGNDVHGLDGDTRMRTYSDRASFAT